MFLIVVTLAVVAWTVPASAGVQPAGSSQPTDTCASLIGLTVPDLPMTVTVATLVPALGYQNNPVDMCRIAGYLTPTSVSHIEFEVWMPTTTWNGRYNGVGNGGLAGSIGFGAMRTALGWGYATASTNTGHWNYEDPATWAIGHPYPPEKLIDFASRSIHLTAVAAKAFIAAYYGRPADYSYFTGCSGGGGQALSEAQRYPEDYDGIVAGAPANFPTHMWPGELYAAWVNRSDPTNDPFSYIITQDKLPIINAAAVAACDAIDGLVDGLIDDPRRCTFDPATIVCQPGQTENCITAAQADVVEKVYAGLKDPTTSAQFWAGYEPGGELQWWGHIGDPFSIPKTYFRYMVWDNMYPNWAWNTFDFSLQSNFDDVLYPASADLGRTLDSINTDLSPFAARGGKLIMWHGWNDQNIAPRNSISYYEGVEAALGNPGRRVKIDTFFRLFMVPGMGHCSGGPGATSFDSLAALRSWVEEGVAPARIIGTNPTSGLTRPFCPYPAVTTYRGGDPNDPDNFVCKKPKR
jgi:feruloyl esterase